MPNIYLSLLSQRSVSCHKKKVTGHKKISSFQITEIHFNLIFHLYLYPFKLVDQLSYHFPISVPFPFPSPRSSTCFCCCCCCNSSSTLLMLCVLNVIMMPYAVAVAYIVTSVVVVVVAWSVVRLSLHKSYFSTFYISSFRIRFISYISMFFFDVLCLSYRCASVRLWLFVLHQRLCAN